MRDFNVVILAAGHGKRMNNRELPKVLIPINGKPMVQHVLDAIRASGITEKPVMVIGQRAEQVKAAIGDQCNYAYQAEQLGTGHAVGCARRELEGQAAHVMVLYGDMPFISAATIANLAKTHLQEKRVLTLGTITVPDFKDWRQGLHDFGRIVRNAEGEITEIVERKDATPEQLEIREVNPSYLCFASGWLWQHIDTLTNHNSQAEYYLIDLIKIAREQSRPIASVQIDPKEGLGINTAEQLHMAAAL